MDLKLLAKAGENDTRLVPGVRSHKILEEKTEIEKTTLDAYAQLSTPCSHTEVHMASKGLGVVENVHNHQVFCNGYPGDLRTSQFCSAKLAIVALSR